MWMVVSPMCLCCIAMTWLSDQGVACLLYIYTRPVMGSPRPYANFQGSTGYAWMDVQMVARNQRLKEASL